MTRMTGPDCAIMCNLINIHTHIHTYIQVPLIPPWEDQCEWHRMTRMTGPDCCGKYTYIHTYIHTYTHGATVLGQADARRLGGRYARRTDLVPLR